MLYFSVNSDPKAQETNFTPDELSESYFLKQHNLAPHKSM